MSSRVIILLVGLATAVPSLAWAQQGNVRDAIDLERKGIDAKMHGDFQGAHDFLKQAAELGYYPAQVDYAYLLETAPPPVQNLPEAYGWYAAIATHPDGDFAREAQERILKKAPASDREKFDEMAQDYINRFGR